MAAALAYKLSKSGEKTLLVELGERGFYSHAWGRPFGFQPTSVDNNLWVSRWSGEESLREYIGHLIKVKKFVDLIFENRIMKALVRAAPALNELSILGKLTSGIRKIGPAFEYDHVVVDAYATGHFKALINAPKGMSEAIPKGPMGDQSRAMNDILKNSNLVKIYIVALPEELPVNESQELADFLKSDFNQTPKFIVNKCLETKLSTEQLSDFLSAHTSRLGRHLLMGVGDQKKYHHEFQQRSSVLDLPHLWLPTSTELYQKLSAHIPGEFYA